MSQEAVTVKAEMLIRKPVHEVFQAFIDPTVTTHFWFTKSSGKLEQGKQIQWTWEMFSVGTTVDVKAIEENKRILIEWDGEKGRNLVEWIFTARSEDTTMVSIGNSGFSGTADEIFKQALDAKQGFTIVVCGLKVWLEHGINPNFIADHFPDAVVADFSVTST